MPNYKWPTTIEENYDIIFDYAEMPDQTENLFSYRSEAIKATATEGMITLPLPAQMEDASNHTWNLTKGLQSQLLQKGMDAAMVVADGLSLSAASSIKDSAGLHLDPNFFYTYQSSEPRSFSYSINMIPKDEAEAKNIMGVIKTFKKYSSPIQGVFVKNYKWNISIGNSQLKKAMSMHVNPWVLVSVSTNYTGAGSSLFFEDGMPKQVNLTLAFNEMSVMYNTDWE